MRDESESISPYNTPPYPSLHVQFVQFIPSIDALPVKEEREIILPFPSCSVMFSKEESVKVKVSVEEEEEGMEMSEEDWSVISVKCALMHAIDVCVVFESMMMGLVWSGVEEGSEEEKERLESVTLELSVILRKKEEEDEEKRIVMPDMVTSAD